MICMKIDVLLPQMSLYEVLHHFTRKLYEALVRAGHSCRLLEGDQRFLVPLESPPDFTIGFNGGLKIEDGRLFCDLIQVPHVACLVDPPFRFFELTSSPFVVITCDDSYCCEDLRSMKFRNAFFMPHAVERELAPEPDVERIYDLAMLATFVDCEKRKAEWSKKFPSEICRGMEKAAGLALADEKTSFLLTLKQALGSHLYTAAGQYKMDLNNIKLIFSEVELYIKGRDKLDLLNAITDHEVHVFGNSIDETTWQHYCKDRPNIIVHPGVSFTEALEVMKRTKILLNSCIKNKQGAHERIFSGAACGAVVVTNENEYLKKQFVDGQELILYHRSAFHDVNDRIHKLLADESQRQAIADRGRQKVMSHHTWDHRVAELIHQITPVIQNMKQ